MATPWDPRPAPPAPAWVANVQQTLDVVTLMENTATARLATAQPAYDAQASVLAAVVAGQQWQVLQGVSGELVRLAAAVTREKTALGELKIYRNAVNNYALNQPFYDAHPALAQPAFPVMGQDLLDYLAGIRAQ